MFQSVVGETVEGRNLICLDYPEIKPIFSGSWTSGDFGPVPSEIGKITGKKITILNFMICILAKHMEC